MVKKILTALTLLIVVFAVTKLTLEFYLQKKVNLTSPLIYEIKKGAHLGLIGQDLADKNVITYPELFTKLGRYYGYASRLKFGEYLIEPQDSYRDVLDKIISGKTHRYKITFVEGDHIYKYARQVDALGIGRKEVFLKLVKDKAFIKKLIGEERRSLEGYLFPDTYSFSKNDGERVIISSMVNKFLSQIKKLNLKKTHLNRHELVTLASIIEKETGASFERPTISAVFHNRLRKRMRLQTDPTILYGIMDKTGRETLNIRKKDIKERTDYNTYVINGLPPGPIANPGFASLKAALSPENSDFLYFVSRNDGTHVFTTNYKDHLAAVKKFQLDPKMKAGKSWRDLNKNQNGSP